jgi:KaiC/GvpD/RAD55 family RecA-like ATPase
MRDVARILQLLNPQPNLLWIDPEQFNLPPKGDVVDYLDEWRGSASDNKIAVQAALDQAQPMDGAGELSQLIEDTIAGKRFNVPWPWPELTRLTRALMPGTVTCLCGDGGATKSYLLLQAAYFWFANDFQFVIYELEEDRAYHLNRLLAQLAENSDLTDSDWIKSHPDESREATRKFQVSIGEFAKWMQDAPDEQLSLDELKNWTLQMASAGKRVIVIDPITAAKQEDKPWIADLNFVMAVKTIARQHGASIILVTHPRKGRRTVTTIHDLAGGAAYQRFAQTVLWIQRLDQEKNVIVRRSYGTGHQDQAVSINRTLQIHKARNGRGSGLEIGFNFSGNSLLFAEQGVITEDA